VLAGEKGIVNTGCSAIIEKVLNQYPDGRMDVLTVGRRRFEILLLNDEGPYLRGAVEFFDDDDFDPIPPGVRERVIEGYNDLRNIASAEALNDPEMTDPQLSFQLAQVVPDLNFRQTLLATRSEAERMKRLADFFPPFNSRQRQIAHIKRVAPRNGHGKWPPTA
jgi:Lon protease-like protein